jgi:hypothetical protein
LVQVARGDHHEMAYLFSTMSFRIAIANVLPEVFEFCPSAS